MATPLLEQLIDALRILPGVGPKSAQRMAYHLLERDRDGAKQLSIVLNEAVEHIGHCKLCRTLSENELCHVCANPGRESTLLCIVESPIDVQAIMQSTEFKGLFFVLMGHLSPLDGIGPEDLGLDKLAKRLDEDKITEVIIATNPTVEGEATSHYIAEMVNKRNITATRIAHGVPMGGELEYVSGSTLLRAFSGRSTV